MQEPSPECNLPARGVRPLRVDSITCPKRALLLLPIRAQLGNPGMTELCSYWGPLYEGASHHDYLIVLQSHVEGQQAGPPLKNISRQKNIFFRKAFCWIGHFLLLNT